MKFLDDLFERNKIRLDKFKCPVLVLKTRAYEELYEQWLKEPVQVQDLGERPINHIVKPTFYLGMRIIIDDTLGICFMVIEESEYLRMKRESKNEDGGHNG
jgi:hypothetical protein